MDLSDVIGTAGNGLDQIFFQIYLPVYQTSDSLECRIHRTVPARSGHAFLSVDDEFDSSHRYGILSADYLQVFQMHSLFEFVLGHTCYYIEIRIIDFLLAVCQFQELVVCGIQLFLVHMDAQTLEMMVE